MYAKVAVNTAYSSNVIQYRDYNFPPPLSLSLSLSLSLYLSIYLSTYLSIYIYIYRSSSRIIAARMSSNGKGTVSNEEEAYVDMQ